MITYLVKTMFGLVAFDSEFERVEIIDGDELPAYYVSVDERHLFTQEELDEHEVCETLEESYVSTVRLALLSKMARNASEILLNVEKRRMRLKYYAKLQKVYPLINAGVVKTIEEEPHRKRKKAN